MNQSEIDTLTAEGIRQDQQTIAKLRAELERMDARATELQVLCDRQALMLGKRDAQLAEANANLDKVMAALAEMNSLNESLLDTLEVQQKRFTEAPPLCQQNPAPNAAQAPTPNTMTVSIGGAPEAQPTEAERLAMLWPHIGADEYGNAVLTWINGERRLTLYTVGHPHESLLKSWGPNMDAQMAYVSLLEAHAAREAFEWLAGAKTTGA